ncbi:MAG: hypothetical protein AB7U76_24405 [Pirellulales bacterium]
MLTISMVRIIAQQVGNWRLDDIAYVIPEEKSFTPQVTFTTWWSLPVPSYPTITLRAVDRWVPAKPVCYPYCGWSR